MYTKTRAMILTLAAIVVASGCTTDPIFTTGGAGNGAGGGGGVVQGGGGTGGAGSSGGGGSFVGGSGGTGSTGGVGGATTSMGGTGGACEPVGECDPKACGEVNDCDKVLACGGCDGQQGDPDKPGVMECSQVDNRCHCIPENDSPAAMEMCQGDKAKPIVNEWCTTQGGCHTFFCGSPPVSPKMADFCIYSQQFLKVDFGGETKYVEIWCCANPE